MIIAVIPARKGSVGIKNKNLQKINEISLIDRSIKYAKESNLFDKIIVTTDYNESLFDSKNVIVRNRPKELTTNESTMVDVLEDVIEYYNINQNDKIILLQPTSPFRDNTILDKFISKLTYYDSAITVKELDINYELIFDKLNIEELVGKNIDSKKTNRQYNTKKYIPNGNLFGVKVKSFLIYKSFYGGKIFYEEQFDKYNIDINKEEDLILAKFMEVNL